MRNLKLVKHFTFCDTSLKNAQFFCIDPDQAIIYFLTSDLHVWKVDYHAEKDKCTLLVNLDFISKAVNDGITSFDYIVSEQFLCVGKRNGDIIKHAFDETEIADFILDGIKAMSWSPDQELVAIISGGNQLFLKTSDFVVVQVLDIETIDFGESKPVNVGWGKKETQFHGSVGKAAAFEKQSIEPVSQFDDERVRISWREDGQFFVFSYITTEGRFRQLRVCSREGVLQYTSEYVPGLEQALFWQPSGTLIASTIRKPNKHVVAFFEKNCLQHGEFALPGPQEKFKVNEILWNYESAILAVWLQNITTDAVTESHHFIQIWTVNNYHWYLKQQLNFGFNKLAVCQVQWSSCCANQLNILCLGGQFFTYTWQWTISRTNGPLEDHNGIVGVIDGYAVKLTPFRQLVVPPPLCAYSFNFEAAVNSILFGSQTKNNEFVIVLDNYEMLHFSNDTSICGGNSDFKIKTENNNMTSPYVCTGNIELKGLNAIKCFGPSSLMHWTWSSSDEILFVYTVEMKSILCIATISWDFNKLSHSAEVRSIPLEGEIVQMSSSFLRNRVAIQLNDGSFIKYSHEDSSITPWYFKNQIQLALPQSSSDFSLVTNESIDHVLALVGTSLFYDDNELAEYCTSFCVTDDFIIYTTSDHLLHCVSKHSLTQDRKKSVPVTEKLRNVERGSKIITATCGSKLIFQMPRGNLETIYPRSLVLHVIRNLLNKLNYVDAIVMMKRHRIDMNLFVDYDLVTFLNNVNNFVEQIDDVNLFNLFLSYLSDEDVTSTIYALNFESLSKNNCPESMRNNKVDIVCDTFRKELEKRDSNKYFFSILTCYVKKKIPELEKALHKIKELSSVKAQDGALDYLHRLVNVDELFNIALGTYDFQLVTMVAEKTQKDPKDYLPFLNQVRNLESNYGKFIIDKHLKRYSRALDHIIKSGDENIAECMSFIESHHLYSEAVKLMPKTHCGYLILFENYGDYLTKRNMHEEAGLMFMKGKFYEKALEAFKRCSNWIYAFCAAHELNYSNEAITQLGKQLSVNLISERRYLDAAYITETYANDVEESIKILIQGHEWERAVMMIHKAKATKLIEDVLKPSMLDHHSHLLSTLQQKSSTFERYRKRLKIVREQKRAKLMSANDDDDDKYSVDQFSETSSSRFAFSGITSTASTSRTARNKRKQERKRVSLKEGSPFEDVALLEALTDIMIQTNDTKDECKSLCKILSMFDFTEEAYTLQSDLESSLKSMLSFKSEIWPPEENESSEKITLGPSTTSNMLADQNIKCLQERPTPSEYLVYTHPPSLKDVNWKLSFLTYSNHR